METKLEVLRLGADDYIIKPFDINEVIVRIEVVLRRVQTTKEKDVLESGGLKLILTENRAEYEGKPVQLTAKEMSLLELFMKNPKKTYTKAELYESVWNDVYYYEDNTINVHVSNLRNKLKKSRAESISKLSGESAIVSGVSDMWRIAAIAAIICCMMLVVYLLALKRQMRNITDELDRTAKRSYNRLVSIPLFDNDLNSLTSAINREIDDRKRMKIKSEETEKALRQAISDIAHDLRTPLSVIKGELQIMNGNPANTPEQKHYIDVCIRKTDELKNMADGFF